MRNPLFILLDPTALCLVFGLALTPLVVPREQNLTQQAFVAFEQGDYNKAIAICDKAISLNPRNLEAYNTRGMAYTYKREYEKALADFAQALRLDAQNPTIYYNRGCLHGKKGEYDKAIADYNVAIRLTPRSAAEQQANALALINRADAYYQTRDYEKALSDYKQGIRRDPQEWRPYDGVAWILATSPHPGLRDGRKAVEYATKACELSKWKIPTNVDTLAAAYAEAGNFTAAIKWEQRAVGAGRLSQDDTAEYKNRVALYQANKPYHEEKPHPPRPAERF